MTEKNVTTIVSADALDPARLRYLGDKEINVYIDGKKADLVKIETVPKPTDDDPEAKATSLYFKTSSIYYIPSAE